MAFSINSPVLYVITICVLVLVLTQAVTTLRRSLRRADELGIDKAKVKKVLRTAARLYRSYHPMGFFGGLALVLVALALLFFLPVFSTYLQTGLVPKIPTLIVCAFTMVAAIQSLFTGLTLHTLMQKSRQDFELQLHRVSDHKKVLLKQ